MKTIYPRILVSVTILGTVLFTTVCWHSVEEIHYLKSFFPERFTVQEACHAAVIELVKVVLIGMPVALIISVALYFWRHADKKR